MNILIDAHMLGEQEGGNETYIAGLLQGFASTTLPEDTRLTVLLQPHYSLPCIDGEQLQTFTIRNSSNLSRLFLEIPSLCRRLHTDVLHVTYNASPWLSCAMVVSVHDVIFHRYPNYFAPRVRLLLSTLLPLTMRRASVILTLSEASKRDIVYYYPFTQDKIIVIPPAAGPLINLEPDMAMVDIYTGGEDFILAVGTVQPRKNIARLIHAYIRLRQHTITTVKLLIVGRSAWQHSEIQRIAANSPYSQDIVFTGYLPDAVVAALYRACTVFIYPSLYEGFGLPVLEAMACGAPVITSNCSSLPEVAGDAALFVDSYDVEQISRAIEQVLNDVSLRSDLRVRGLRRAACFSWEQTAVKTLEAYKWALQMRGKL
jgi:glycosyltransferase involved in cell wall biosynthesis